MKYIFILCALVCAGCCTSDKCVAVVTSNSMHAAGVAAAAALSIGCTERYKAATTPEQLSSLDVPCLPAAEAYRAFAGAQAGLEAILTAVLAGDPGRALQAALAGARAAALTLATKIGALPK